MRFLLIALFSEPQLYTLTLIKAANSHSLELMTVRLSSWKMNKALVVIWRGRRLVFGI
jgi:hypothetical protein